jgi:hypothetical protein
MAYTNIDDPSAHFQTATYSNNGSTITVTNDGNSDLQPDLIWNKQRTNGGYHGIWDSSRGTNKSLSPNVNASEQPNSGKGITSFNTDGFTGVEGSWAEFNQSGQTSVAWQWKCNAGSTSSNTDGSITSTVQANTDAGFSIVTYTGNATDNATVGHGLGVVPSVIIIKDLTDGSVWGVWHKDLTDAGYRLTLSSDAATSNDPGFMGGGNRTLPTSSVFSLGQGGGGNGTNAYVAYCFAEKQGYSKFGSYVGNGNANGPFVYTGFKPAFLLVKKSSDTGNWLLYDNKGEPGNMIGDYFYANLANAESGQTTNGYDFLSNGFKVRNVYGDGNVSGQTYIYMAFAENPFTTSTGVPTTAR